MTPSDRLVAPAEPYRLEVLAVDVRDAVRHAGGLICDKAMSGWRVEVIVADWADPSALRILGARQLLLDEANACRRGQPADALVVCASLVRDDERTRCRFDRAHRTGRSETATWIPDAEDGCDVYPTTHVVYHHLSGAASAFKTQAGLALGLATAPHATETFLSPGDTPFTRLLLLTTDPEPPFDGTAGTRDGSILSLSHRP